MRAWPLEPRRRILVEYVLIAGVNDREEDAGRLARLLRGLPVKVNVIPLNEDPTYLPGWKRPDEAAIDRFVRAPRRRARDRHGPAQQGTGCVRRLRSVEGEDGGSEDGRAPTGRQVGREELLPLPRVGELRGAPRARRRDGSGRRPRRSRSRCAAGSAAASSRVKRGGTRRSVVAVHEQDRRRDARGGADRVDGVEAARASGRRRGRADAGDGRRPPSGSSGARRRRRQPGRPREVVPRHLAGPRERRLEPDRANAGAVRREFERDRRARRAGVDSEALEVDAEAVAGGARRSARGPPSRGTRA